MKKIPRQVLQRMADALPPEERDEMAIPSYLHPNPMLRWMAWRRLEVIADHFHRWFASRPPVDKGAQVLDFGCGTGVLFREALQHASRVYGVDIVLHAARMLKEQEKLERVVLLDPSEVAEEIDDSSIDAVIAAEVLEHFEDLTEPLTMFERVLKPDGRLFVSVPTESRLYKLGRRLAGFEGHYHHSDAAAIDAAVTRFGFRQVARSHVPAPGPLSIYWVVEYAPPER